MSSLDFKTTVCYLIRTTDHAFTLLAPEILEGTGISLRQAEVLGWLMLKSQRSQSEVAKLMRLEPSTLVGILDRMERDGWIERVKNPSDRRKKMIQTTDKALQAWASIEACGHRLNEKAIKGISRSELNAMMKTLKKVRHNLGYQEE